MTRGAFTFGCRLDSRVVTKGNVDDTTFIRAHGTELDTTSLRSRLARRRTGQGLELLTLPALVALDVDDDGEAETDLANGDRRDEELQCLERLPMTADEDRQIITGRSSLRRR